MNITWTIQGSVDASDLGWGPGEWPNDLAVTLPGGLTVVLERLHRLTRPGTSIPLGYEYGLDRHGDTPIRVTVHND